MSIPKIGITMIGGSRTGKSCYLCAMAHEMAIQQNGFTFSPNMLDFRSEASMNARKLRGDWRKMQHVYDESGNIVQRGIWIEGTDRSGDYDFLCSYAGRPLVSFVWHDYRGAHVHGDMQGLSGEEQTALFDRINDSACLIVCIAAERLQALIRGSDEAVDEFGTYAGFLMNYRAAKGKTVPVVFAITKADKLRKGEFQEGVEILRNEIFGQFFQVGRSEDWFMMFVGVSLGEFEDSNDRMIYGEFCPQNIHLPVLFAVRCALLEQMQTSKGSLDKATQQETEKKNELDRENNRSALGKFFLGNAPEIEEQLKKLSSEMDGIKGEIEQLTSDLTAITKELIGDDSDVVQLYIGGRKVIID